MSKSVSNTEVYAEIISSIALKASSTIDGAEVLSSNPGRKSKNSRDVQAYIVGDKVSVDIFVNVYYGYNIPDVVSKLQAAVKSAVENETCYKTKSINVTVVSILFKDGEAVSCTAESAADKK